MAQSERKEDLRVKRTNRMLNEAIFDMLKTRSIDKISVVDLCEAAKIHRATFYKHYKDKEGFIEHIISMQVDKLYNEAKSRIMTDDPTEYVRGIADVTIDFADRNKNLILANSESSEGAGLMGILASVLSRELKYQIGKTAGESDDDKYLDVVSHYLAGGFIYLLGWWISNDTGITKQELIDSIVRLVLPNNNFEEYYKNEKV